MDGVMVGYARCSTDEQDLTAQRDALARLGVPAARVYVDHGRTGTNRDRPGLRQGAVIGGTAAVPGSQLSTSWVPSAEVPRTRGVNAQPRVAK